MARQNLIPAGLLLLSAIPVVAGSLRLTELAGGASTLPDSDRITSLPVPVAIHIISVTVFSILGAFQFAPSFRRRRRGWHRAAGRVVLPCGIVAALSGLWLTLFLPRSPADSALLAVIRVAVAAAMVTFLVLGYRAVRRREFTRHRAWMIRGYAIGLGAGTQAFTQAPWLILIGTLTPAGKVVTLTAGWLINILAAEWIIRRGRTGRVARRLPGLEPAPSAAPRPPRQP
ncbi:DUF2306 domain-containing protein [Actinoplanes sp. GCM10030250]|uniref:DUF2306 domain-containing protein n=1 Tax=Actinoplanes sp. GCM10030250 TaxID=3273376 RepID=UPI00360C61ED